MSEKMQMIEVKSIEELKGLVVMTDKIKKALEIISKANSMSKKIRTQLEELGFREKKVSFYTCSKNLVVYGYQKPGYMALNIGLSNKGYIYRGLETFVEMK